MGAELQRSSEEDKQTSEQPMERREEGKSGCVGAWRVVRAPQQSIRILQDPSGTLRNPQDPSGPIKTPQDPSGPLRNPQDPSEPLKTPQEPPGSPRNPQDLSGTRVWSGFLGGFSPPSTLQLVVFCCPSDVQQRDRPGTELSSPAGQREMPSVCCSSRLAAVTMTTGQSQRCLRTLGILLVFLLQLVLTPPVLSSCPPVLSLQPATLF